MFFTFQPSDFAPVNEGLLYGFDTQSSEPCSVQFDIVDADTSVVVGRKTLYGVTTGTVDIAPYVRIAADASTPMRTDGSALCDAPCRRYKVVAEGAESTPITVADNRVTVGEKTSLTTMTRQRKIAFGERDELRLFGGRGATFAVTIRTSGGDEIVLHHTSASGAVILTVDTSDFSRDTRTAEVCIECDGREIPSLCYTVSERCGKDLRLVWVSSAGTVERYTFPVVRSMTRNTVHRRIVAADGTYRTAECITDETVRLVSAYEPHGVAQAVAEVAASPCVWIEGKAVDSATEVLGSSITFYEFGRPDCVEVDLRTGCGEVRL